MTLFLWKEEARKVGEVGVTLLLSTKDEEVSQEDIEACSKCLATLARGCLEKAAIESLELLGRVSRADAISAAIHVVGVGKSTLLLPKSSRQGLDRRPTRIWRGVAI